MQTGVIQPQLAQQGRMEVVDTHHILNRLVAKLIGRPVDMPRLSPNYSTATQSPLKRR